ncbi:MAG TPA: endolytic transglycosylase MltG, partial [Marmoricola sp.]|nr:endolytic transglycosylase MltG [Marmoricola sp.]
DMNKVARVFYNRLAQGMLLQSDATVAFANNLSGTVWTTDAQRNNPSPYNTYVHKGLPPGPIDNPGLAAIQAALHPAAGPWLYFVPVNLKTGETVYSTTYADHQKAVAQLQAWCAQTHYNGCK